MFEGILGRNPGRIPVKIRRGQSGRMPEEIYVWVSEFRIGIRVTKRNCTKVPGQTPEEIPRDI